METMHDASGMRDRVRVVTLALAICACGGFWPPAASSQPSPSDQSSQQQQQPSPVPPPAPRTSPAPTTPPFVFGNFLAASRGTTFARTPAMFGDSFYSVATITAFETLAGGGSMTLVGSLPVAGGARRTLIAEHNKARPTDRAYFNFNYFHNALRSRVSGLTMVGMPPGPFAAARQRSVDRYLFGIEKTYLDGLGSVELRMPISGRYNFAFDTGADVFPETASVTGGHVGNLALIFKTALYNDMATVVSAGLGVDIPTGDDASALVGVTRYELRNEAVHLSPYFAVMRNPNDLFFWHMFGQLDVAANGNRFSFRSIPPDAPAGGELGKFTDQTLFHLDVGGGVWLIRRPDAPLLTGVAAINEIHYTDTFQKTDSISAARATLFPPGATVDLRNPANWMNVVNFTTGVHFEMFGGSTLRIAGAVPLTQRDDRFFDSEILVQFGQRY
jgi:hypothetical protein